MSTYFTYITSCDQSGSACREIGVQVDTVAGGIGDGRVRHPPWCVKGLLKPGDPVGHEFGVLGVDGGRGLELDRQEDSPGGRWLPAGGDLPTKFVRVEHQVQAVRQICAGVAV